MNTLTCGHCGWVRCYFGTKEDADASALKMGWEYRPIPNQPDAATVLCPHCRYLV